MASPLQLALKFREQYSVPVREELDQLVASLAVQIPASVSSAIAAIPPAPVESGWILIPFVASDFSGNGSMTWTVAAGGVGTWQYRVSNHTCWVMFDVAGTVGGTLNTLLQMRTPVPAVVGGSQAVVTEQGVNQLGLAGASIPTIISVYKDPTQTTNWAAGIARVIGTIMLRRRLRGRTPLQSAPLRVSR